MSTFSRFKNQVKFSKRASRSGQIMLKDLKSNRSWKSFSQSNQNKKRSRASAYSTLGSIYSFRVSKAAERKASRHQRQYKSLAEHSDDQNQGPDITISSLSPFNVVQRRRSRLSNNEKRSAVLKVSLAVNRSNNTHSSSLVLRRNDRLFKQKERMTTSISDIVVNSVVIDSNSRIAVQTANQIRIQSRNLEKYQKTEKQLFTKKN